MKAFSQALVVNKGLAFSERLDISSLENRPSSCARSRMLLELGTGTTVDGVWVEELDKGCVNLKLQLFL